MRALFLCNRLDEIRYRSQQPIPTDSYVHPTVRPTVHPTVRPTVRPNRNDHQLNELAIVDELNDRLLFKPPHQQSEDFETGEMLVVSPDGRELRLLPIEPPVGSDAKEGRQIASIVNDPSAVRMSSAEVKVSQPPRLTPATTIRTSSRVIPRVIPPFAHLFGDIQLRDDIFLKCYLNLIAFFDVIHNKKYMQIREVAKLSWGTNFERMRTLQSLSLNLVGTNLKCGVLSVRLLCKKFFELSPFQLSTITYTSSPIHSKKRMNSSNQVISFIILPQLFQIVGQDRSSSLHLYDTIRASNTLNCQYTLLGRGFEDEDIQNLYNKTRDMAPYTEVVTEKVLRDYVDNVSEETIQTNKGIHMPICLFVFALKFTADTEYIYLKGSPRNQIKILDLIRLIYRPFESWRQDEKTRNSFVIYLSVPLSQKDVSSRELLLYLKGKDIRLIWFDMKAEYYNITHAQNFSNKFIHALSNVSTPSMKETATLMRKIPDLELDDRTLYILHEFTLKHCLYDDVEHSYYAQMNFLPHINVEHMDIGVKNSSLINGLKKYLSKELYIMYGYLDAGKCWKEIEKIHVNNIYNRWVRRPNGYKQVVDDHETILHTEIKERHEELGKKEVAKRGQKKRRDQVSLSEPSKFHAAVNTIVKSGEYYYEECKPTREDLRYRNGMAIRVYHADSGVKVDIYLESEGIVESVLVSSMNPKRKEDFHNPDFFRFIQEWKDAKDKERYEEDHEVALHSLFLAPKILDIFEEEHARDPEPPPPRDNDYKIAPEPSADDIFSLLSALQEGIQHIFYKTENGTPFEEVANKFAIVIAPSINMNNMQQDEASSTYWYNAIRASTNLTCQYSLLGSSMFEFNSIPMTNCLSTQQSQFKHVIETNMRSAMMYREQVLHTCLFLISHGADTQIVDGKIESTSKLLFGMNYTLKKLVDSSEIVSKDRNGHPLDRTNDFIRSLETELDVAADSAPEEITLLESTVHKVIYLLKLTQEYYHDFIRADIIELEYGKYKIVPSHEENKCELLNLVADILKRVQWSGESGNTLLIHIDSCNLMKNRVELKERMHLTSIFKNVIISGWDRPVAYSGVHVQQLLGIKLMHTISDKVQEKERAWTGFTKEFYTEVITELRNSKVKNSTDLENKLLEQLVILHD